MAIGTPTLLGSVGGTTSVSSKTFTTVAAIPAGALSVILVNYYNSGASSVAVTSVSDGTNTYTQAVFISQGSSTPSAGSLYYCNNCLAVGSGATVTVTWAGNTAGQAIIGAVVTGIASSSSLDKTASAATATNTPTVSTGTLSVSNEIVFGLVSGYNYTASTEDATFTNIANIYPNQLIGTLGYKIVSSTGSVTYSPILVGGAIYTPIAVATFQGISYYPIKRTRNFIEKRRGFYVNNL